METIKILDIKDEAEGVKTFTFEKPEGFAFEPGQYCWLSLPDFTPSPMAIASGTKESELKFSVRAWGKLTQELFQMTPGDEVTLDGPHGTYFPKEITGNPIPLYMVAGGTGVTPIRSLVYSTEETNKNVVFYGAKQPQELLYRKELTSWPAEINLTVDQEDPTWDGHVGLVTRLMANYDLNTEGVAFVCGPKMMEQAVVDFLREIGFTDERIYVSLERFDEKGNVVGPVLPASDPIVGF